jgi:catalase
LCSRLRGNQGSAVYDRSNERSYVETADGATVKIIIPKIGGVKLKSGKLLPADGQLAGTPSILFDAVVIITSPEGCELLMNEAAAIDFAKDAFGHLKAIGFTPNAMPLLDKAGVQPDAGIVDVSKNTGHFIKPAPTRQWERERKVRLLA